MDLASTPAETLSFLQRRGREAQALEYDRLVRSSGIQSVIPPFFNDGDFQENAFRIQMVHVRENYILRQIENVYPSLRDIDDLRDLLPEILGRANSPSASRGPPKTITYKQYKQLRLRAPEAWRSILTARLFAEIDGHGLQTINVDELFDHLEMVALSVIHFVTLRRCDRNQTGNLTREEFATYVKAVLPIINGIQDMAEQQPAFPHYFIEFVAERIWVVLDTLRSGRVSIHELVNSQLYERFVLLNIDQDPRRNPFSLELVDGIATEFEELDQDHDHVLTIDDLARLPFEAKFTRAFASHLVDTFSSQGQIDFAWYCRLHFTWDNRGAPWANAAMFEVLDIDGSGDITEVEVQYFYKEMQIACRRLDPNTQVEPVESFIAERIDHAGMPRMQIHKDMFIRSDMVRTIVQPLVDFTEFRREFNVEPVEEPYGHEEGSSDEYHRSGEWSRSPSSSSPEGASPSPRSGDEWRRQPRTPPKGDGTGLPITPTGDYSPSSP
jgi:Ca2+-binding EF-hand superfamily protein